MPGKIRAVQVILWISVVLQGLALVLGFAGLGVLQSRAPELMTRVVIGLVVIAIVTLVMLILAIQVPGGRRGTRTGIIVLLILSLLGRAYNIFIAGDTGLGIFLGVVVELLALAFVSGEDGREWFRH